MNTTWHLDIGANVTPNGVTFRVWAPQAERVDVVIYEDGTERSRHPLTREASNTQHPTPNTQSPTPGYWLATIAGLGAGTRYAYSLDGDAPRPDPASRFQPDGVHAPSEVIDPQTFAWSDHGWRGVDRSDLIIYELHVGTATPAGTFSALIDKLPYFRDLGVTALEIMPVHDFPGCRNWGYDGVDLFAPARCYGAPDDFRQLIDAAHAHGLAIVLDVVYNHFGPDGNYLRVFSPDYFTAHHHTPWGDALNLDADGSEAVRHFLISNALHWAHEYHVDGFRLDATQALIDDSPTHLLQALTATVRASLPADRHFVITAEDDRNNARLAQPQPQGYGLDGLWADDFHHQVRVALTGTQQGYFSNYTGSAADLATTVADGWFYCGQPWPATGNHRGSDPTDLHYDQFVYCIQNHDQVGNLPLGSRLNHMVDQAAYCAASALLLLAPETPLLWMGQEWAASTPFQYFTDHNAELGKLVSEGRRREFAYFLKETGIEVPDPQAQSTFDNSKLRWDEIEQPEHAAVLALYRDLIRLRRSHSALLQRDRASVQVEAIGDRALLLRRGGLLIIVNLGAAIDLTLPSSIGSVGEILLDSNDARYGGTAQAQIEHEQAGPTRVQMPGPGVVVAQHAT